MYLVKNVSAYVYVCEEANKYHTLRGPFFVGTRVFFSLRKGVCTELNCPSCPEGSQFPMWTWFAGLQGGVQCGDTEGGTSFGPCGPPKGDQYGMSV